MAAIDRCHAHGLEVTILATLMNSNYDQMDGLVAVAREPAPVSAQEALQEVAAVLRLAPFSCGKSRATSE